MTDMRTTTLQTTRSPTRKDIMHGTAAKLYDANGGIHISIDPITPDPPGHLLDPNGHEVVPVRKSLMVRLDTKIAETMELRKGTLWAIGIAPVFLMLLFNYGSAALGWARDDQTQRGAVQQLQNEVRESREEMKAMAVKLDELSRAVAEKQGYEKGVQSKK